MNDVHSSKEVDLVELIETIWDGKWKLIAIMMACVVGVLIFQLRSPTPAFVATTEIRPLSASEFEEYQQSNAFGFFAVYPDLKAHDQAHIANIGEVPPPSAVLDQLFVEQLRQLPVLANIMRKKGLLAREDFDSDRDYERALTQLAATVSILPPLNEDGAQRGKSRQHWTLEFRFNDQDKWLAVLAALKDTTNNKVRNIVKASFENLRVSERQRNAFGIEDLDTQISILISAYDAEITTRLAHLTEQAAISRKHKISQQTNIPQPSIYQSLNTQYTEESNNRPGKIETEIPLYLRGYDALEKEIELIKSRSDKNVFIEGLIPLEQIKHPNHAPDYHS